jgi:hypothetical protein
VRAKRQRRVSFEIMSDHEDPIVFQHADGRHAPPQPDALLAIAHTTCKLYRAVRHNVTRDAALLTILDAYARGFVKPREVMKLTRMTRAEFLNARRRLDRALVQLPAVLRRAAQDLISDSRE